MGNAVEYWHIVLHFQPLNLQHSVVGKPCFYSSNLIPSSVSDLHCLLHSSSQLTKWQEHPYTMYLCSPSVPPATGKIFQYDLSKKRFLQVAWDILSQWCMRLAQGRLFFLKGCSIYHELISICATNWTISFHVSHYNPHKNSLWYLFTDKFEIHMISMGNMLCEIMLSEFTINSLFTILFFFFFLAMSRYWLAWGKNTKIGWLWPYSVGNWQSLETSEFIKEKRGRQVEMTTGWKASESLICPVVDTVYLFLKLQLWGKSSLKSEFLVNFDRDHHLFLFRFWLYSWQWHLPLISKETCK